MYVYHIQSGPDKWDHLNICFIYCYIKDLFKAKLHHFKGTHNGENRFFSWLSFFAKFQGYRYFLKHDTIFIFQYSYKARINHKFKDFNTDPII